MGFLDVSAPDEVISELAAHLEETYENALAVTKNENDAIQLALGEVEDWRALGARIQCARSAGGPMNYRTKSLWMPALACITYSSLAMMLLQFAEVRPQLVWTKPVAFFLYWPWLGMLPFCGALGAWLSRRAGGSVPDSERRPRGGVAEARQRPRPGRTGLALQRCFLQRHNPWW